MIHQKILALGICVLALASPPNGHAASASAHLRYRTPDADLILSTVRVTQGYQHTYYESLGWSGNGVFNGGYTGIQMHDNNAPVFIFSLWDPYASATAKPSVRFVKPGGAASRFCCEGDGMKYMDFSLGWSVGDPVTSVVRAWNSGAGSDIGMWTHNARTRVWTHHVTFNYAVPNYHFPANTVNSFIENWSGQAPNSTRSAEYYDVWTRNRADGGWNAVNQASPTVSAGNVRTNGQHQVNAAGRFVLQQGAALAGFSDPLQSQAVRPASPDWPQGSFDSVNASFDPASSKVTAQWTVNALALPQFGYRLQVTDQADGTVVAQAAQVLPQARSHSFVLPATLRNTHGLQVQFELIDLFDRVSPARVVDIPPAGDPSQAGPVPGVPYRLLNVASGKYLQVDGSSTAARAGIVHQPLQAVASQHWLLQPSGTPGVFAVKPGHTLQCIDVPVANMADNVQLIQYPCNGTAHQQIRLGTPDAAGARLLSFVHSGKCLDAMQGTRADVGVKVLQWTCHGGDNQKWKLLPAP